LTWVQVTVKIITYFMYAVCEISGKQYKVVADQPFEVDLQIAGLKQIEAKVLLLAQEGKVKIGKPYLEEKFILTCLEKSLGRKIRVAKFHAKANYRKVTGHRAKMTRVVYSVKK